LKNDFNYCLSGEKIKAFTEQWTTHDVTKMSLATMFSIFNSYKSTTMTYCHTVASK